MGKTAKLARLFLLLLLFRLSGSESIEQEFRKESDRCTTPAEMAVETCVESTYFQLAILLSRIRTQTAQNLKGTCRVKVTRKPNNL